MDRLHRQESLQQQQSSSLMPSTPSLIFNEEKNNKNSIDQQQPPVARERKSKRFQAGSASSSISFYSSFSNEDDGFDEKRNQNNDNSEIFGRRPFDVYPAVNNNTTTEAINSGDRGRQRQQFCSGQGGREEEKREEEGEGEEVIGTGDDLPSNFKSNEGDFDDPIEQFPSEEGRGGELWSDSSTKQLSFYQPQQSCSDNIKSDVDSTQIFHQDQTNQMSQSNSCNNISSKKLSENDETPATLSSTNISREQQNNKFVSSRQPPQPKSRRRASHFATTSSSINELRERNISTEQKNLFLLQQEKKQQNEQNNGQRRNTTSDLIISSKTTTKENARVLDLIKQFNALDKGELPIPTAQTLSTTINSLNNSSLNCSSPSPTKKEEEEHLLITKLDFSHIKPQLSPTKFCLSSPTFKEENLANISISDKTLVEDIKVDTSPPPNRPISNLFSSSSPSPPLTKEGGLDQQQQLKPGQYELAIIRGLLTPDEYSKTQIFCVLLLRPAGLKEGSVGLLLSERPLVRSTPEKNCLNYSIEISKVTCGSIAEKSGYLMQGDRVFFIQDESTEKMRVKEARTLLRAPASSVRLIVGRRQIIGLYQHPSTSSNNYLLHLGNNITNCLTNSSTSGSRTALSASSTSSLTALSEYQDECLVFLTDPVLERYAPDSILVTLLKTKNGIGLSLDGGLNSPFGDRPIFVRKVFGEAAKEGRISPGDEIRRIGSTNLNNFTRYEALRLLRGLPDGPVQLEVYKRIC